MSAGRKNSSLTPKKSAKALISDACRLCGVNFKTSVGDFGGKNKYITTCKGFGVDKIRVADLLII